MTKLKNLRKTVVQTAVIGSASALAMGSNLAMAADGDLDFAPMIAGVSAGAAVTAIVGMGVVKLAPNFARWATNKIASFF